MQPAAPVWIFHRGALGDSVLLWPLLRSLVAAHASVCLVSDRSKALLAARFIPGVDPIDAEQPRFNAMFVPNPGSTLHFRSVHAARVICFLFGEANPVSDVWEQNARAMFPNASIELVAQRPDAILARRMAPDHLYTAPRSNARGPMVIHVGAGSPAKRWPFEAWEAIHRLRLPRRVCFIAGEAEAGTISGSLWDPTHRLNGGSLLTTLEELVETMIEARAFVGFDSGPTHLAAQLGLPTLALFGPTDPVRWGPIGPLTRIISPAAPTRDMGWLTPDIVEHAIGQMCD